jgi:hypothetical protein
VVVKRWIDVEPFEFGIEPSLHPLPIEALGAFGRRRVTARRVEVAMAAVGELDSVVLVQTRAREPARWALDVFDELSHHASN